MFNNSKNKWSRLNKLLNNDTCKSDNFIFCDAYFEVSNKFKEYFSEVGSNLSKIINSVSNIDNYINQIPILSSHFYKPTSVSEIIQIIDKSKNSFACDYYDISMNFIKLIGNYIAIPLTYLFNKCITIGYFPNCQSYSYSLER